MVNLPGGEMIYNICQIYLTTEHFLSLEHLTDSHSMENTQNLIFYGKIIPTLWQTLNVY